SDALVAAAAGAAVTSPSAPSVIAVTAPVATVPAAPVSSARRDSAVGRGWVVGSLIGLPLDARVVEPTSTRPCVGTGSRCVARSSVRAPDLCVRHPPPGAGGNGLQHNPGAEKCQALRRSNLLLIRSALRTTHLSRVVRQMNG